MLEFLFLAFLSQGGQTFLHQSQINRTLPQIEVLQPTFIPQKKRKSITPTLLKNQNTAILAMDLDSGKILLHKYSNRPQPVASLSKLMTVFIILENHDLDEIVTVPKEATFPTSSTIDIYQFEQLTVQTLLEAVLIGSANDAAIALAIFHSGSEAQFTKTMNQYARKLNLDSAQFFNATGLDVFINENTKGNTMTAREVLKLSRLLLQNDFVRNTVTQKHFYGTSVDEKFFHEKPSTNQLLGTFLNLKGLKTGFTHLAGECFVALGETKNQQEIITVILGSTDRFGETKTLLSWIYDSFEWR
jgi:D-alanyl-D-alanine carboxypeptidase